MLQSRLDALKKAAQLPLPKVQQTNISRWNFTGFEPFREEAPVQSLDELPEGVKEFVFGEQPVWWCKKTPVSFSSNCLQN